MNESLSSGNQSQWAPPRDYNSLWNLELQWEMCVRNNMSRNINCGSLRRIGKTQTLLRIISNYNREHEGTIVVLTPTRDMGEVYRRNNFINIVPQIFERDVPRAERILLFADEVQNVEEIVRRNGNPRITFIAGFYSSFSAPQPVTWNPSRSETEEIMNHHHQMNRALGISPQFVNDDEIRRRHLHDDMNSGLINRETLVNHPQFFDVSMITDLADQAYTKIEDSDEIYVATVKKHLKKQKQLAKKLKNNKLKFMGKL